MFHKYIYILAPVFFFLFSVSATAEIDDLGEIRIIKANDPTVVREGFGYYYNSLVVLGFSEEGNFAYLEYNNGDAVAYWRLRIVDLVTDEILLEEDWDDDGYAHWHEDLRILDDEKEYITEALEKYNIKPTSENLEGDFPFDYEGDTISAHLVVTSRDTEESLREMGISYSTVEVLVHRGDSFKIIGHYDQSGSSDVFGYIRSPYEDRIVMMILVSRRGFEGSRDHVFKLFGCSLKYGF